jgi:hypothetical protein
MKFPLIYASLICAGLMAGCVSQPPPPNKPPAAAAATDTKGLGMTVRTNEYHPPNQPPAATASTGATATTNALGPKMIFLTNEYHFGKAIKGTLVKYTFIVSNAGDETLEIYKVTPGCHCTTAGDWSKAHEIEPGETGEIPIQFDTSAFSGVLSRTIKVSSNDKFAPNQQLTLQGEIWNPFNVLPQFAYINIKPDMPSNTSSVVHITSKSDEPVTLSDPTSANDKFKAELKTIKPGKEFELTVTAVPPLAPGSTSGTIFVKTSLTNMPEIKITAMAVVLPAVGVTPAQINLPSPMDHWTTNLVTITNNVGQPLALSDPKASDERIRVEIKETTPGNGFQLAAIFPPGFQIAPGRQAQLSVKSNNAQFPVIVVPIKQEAQRQPAISTPLAHPKAMSQNPPPLQATGHP